MSEAFSRTTVLFLDDAPNEHLLLRWAARLVNVPFKIQHFTNPLLVKAYLTHQQPFSNRKIHSDPALALLDYDLGKTTSLELLAWIRDQRKLSNFPIVMFTQARDIAVVRACYAAGASFFVQKPAAFERLQGVLQAIAECFRASRPEFSSLHGLPEHIPFCRGAFVQDR